jgi:hypothetical protein
MFNMILPEVPTPEYKYLLHLPTFIFTNTLALLSQMDTMGMAWCSVRRTRDTLSMLHVSFLRETSRIKLDGSELSQLFHNTMPAAPQKLHLAKIHVFVAPPRNLKSTPATRYVVLLSLLADSARIYKFPSLPDSSRAKKFTPVSLHQKVLTGKTMFAPSRFQKPRT